MQLNRVYVCVHTRTKHAQHYIAVFTRAVRALVLLEVLTQRPGNDHKSTAPVPPLLVTKSHKKLIPALLCTVVVG